MELGLSLGSDFMGKSREVVPNKGSISFCMGLSISPNNPRGKPQVEGQEHREVKEEDQARKKADSEEKPSQDENDIGSQQSKRASDHLLMESDDKISPIQLDLLPNTPVPRSRHHHHQHHPLLIPWPSDTTGNHDLDLEHHEYHHQDQEAAAAEQDVSSSPPNSGASSFQMDFSLYNNIKFASGNEGDHNHRRTRASSRPSDEDENGTRKKLRLSKEQSAFLEESFKEHSTLNPKQKLALAKQLNLRARQVEVWFQNRRARTKLKQTEVDCEYLKRCCETLTEENRRLHKELQELRALKTSNPFYKQLPATTLTMCPSCEKVATTNNNNSNSNSNSTTSSDPTSKTTGLQLTRPRLIYPFPPHTNPPQ